MKTFQISASMHVNAEGVAGAVAALAKRLEAPGIELESLQAIFELNDFTTDAQPEPEPEPAPAAVGAVAELPPEEVAEKLPPEEPKRTRSKVSVAEFNATATKVSECMGADYDSWFRGRFQIAPGKVTAAERDGVHEGLLAQLQRFEAQPEESPVLPATVQQLREAFKARFVEDATDLPKFLKAFEVQRLTELDEAKYAEAIVWLQAN